MKKLSLLIIAMMFAFTSSAQSWNGLSGTWRPTTPSNISPYVSLTFVKILSNQKIKISNVNNQHVDYDLKPIANNGSETILPVDVRKIYGYDSKKIFVRIYNQNNKLRVVRKIYEFDRDGTILNIATADSVMFEFVKLVDNNNYNIVEIQNPLLFPKITGFGNPREDVTYKLSSYTSYKIEIKNIEVLVKGDLDANPTYLFNGKTYARDAFEVTGKVDFVSENGTKINIFNNGNNQIKKWAPSFSTIIPFGTPFEIQQTINFSRQNKTFENSELKFALNIYENDMTAVGSGDSPGINQLTIIKDIKLPLNTLKYGDNQFILYSKNGGSLALNFNITGK